ncbi:hypothetical protein D3C87_1461960 [compost metagenome]
MGSDPENRRQLFACLCLSERFFQLPRSSSALIYRRICFVARYPQPICIEELLRHTCACRIRAPRSRNAYPLRLENSEILASKGCIHRWPMFENVARESFEPSDVVARYSYAMSFHEA